MAAAREGENNRKEVVAGLCRRNIEETKEHRKWHYFPCLANILEWMVIFCLTMK